MNAEEARVASAFWRLAPSLAPELHKRLIVSCDGQRRIAYIDGLAHRAFVKMEQEDGRKLEVALDDAIGENIEQIYKSAKTLGIIL